MTLSNKILCAALGVAFISACGGKKDPPVPLSTVSVDPQIISESSVLPGFVEDEPRPIAAVLDARGRTAMFVENELWFATDDEDELNTFLAEHSGEIVSTIDPERYELTGMTKQYLIRVQTESVDPASLVEDLQTLDPESRGDIVVSSEAAMKLLAAGAQAAVQGMHAGINWVGGASEFRVRESFEAASGPASYDPNAFTWPSHSTGSAQDIGVAEAWRTLDLAGKLVPGSVKVAVLDMGFEPDNDFPSGWLGVSNVPGKNPVGTANILSCGGGSCPWHGTNVVSAAMAVPDNNFGAAGPAGPIADAVMVFTLYDFFTSVTAIGEARIAGAKIANMSYSAPVPTVLAWSVLPFDLATFTFRQTGMLLFAAAGNEGDDVDSTDCLPFPLSSVCWEDTWHTPCENSGVICVGGLRFDSKNRASNSNYGHEHVDIFAPYTLWLGPDPDSASNVAQTKNGTSFSSPFVAGVAALIQAADPSLGAGGIEDIMMDTAHSSPDEDVNRYVNAQAAVHRALGNVPPALDIASPSDGSNRQINFNVVLQATVVDVEEGVNCCTVHWTSNIEGNLGDGNNLDVVFTTVGPRVITASTVDSEGATSTASISLNILNTAPTVSITAPTPTQEIFRGVSTLLRGTSTDINEPGTSLACSALVWTSSVGSDPSVTGCDVGMTFETVGARVIILTGTDPQGLSGTDSVSITVVEPPVDLPPSVQITSPTNGASVNTNDVLSLTATISDDNDAIGDLEFEWRVVWSGAGSGNAVLSNSQSTTWTPSDNVPFDSEGTWNMTIQLEVTDTNAGTTVDEVTVSTVIIN
ncbi:MAG: S8 family serine peptidase [Myxococcota bacterium]